MLKPIGFFVSVKEYFLNVSKIYSRKSNGKQCGPDVSDPLLPNR